MTSAQGPGTTMWLKKAVSDLGDRCGFDEPGIDGTLYALQLKNNIYKCDEVPTVGGGSNLGDIVNTPGADSNTRYGLVRNDEDKWTIYPAFGGKLFDLDDVETTVVTRTQNADIEVFHFLVGQGAGMSITNFAQANILHLACEGGNIQIVKFILQQNVTDVNSRTQDGSTQCKGATIKEDHLHVACEGGNVDIVKYFLTRYSEDINKGGEFGWTPAMYAARHGHREVLHLLESEGADLTKENDDHDNIFYFAILSEDPEIVKYIVKHNTVDINRENDEGMTPVMIAADNGFKEAFHLLVSKGADLTRVNEKRENILHHACRGRGMEIVEYILTRNMVEDIDTRTGTGKTPLMIAASEGNKEVFDLLVKKGANLTLLDEDDKNILHFASEGGNIETVQFILSQHILSINSRGDNGQTAVMTAAKNGHRAVFHLLMENGANSSFIDTNGKDMLYLACDGGNINIAKYIMTVNKELDTTLNR
ncbi:putative ankyrin repeat protein RF_0381 [Haliotis rubra]|uniref:putative ankyrin repeat protein RF_0381 n=1 Tax=Haliotis rubra TaxID=36100 RepID=UPI001EE5F8B0|nr:putative ankyrin repeat protein RF_0381 [Haliotis rubra]